LSDEFKVQNFKNFSTIKMS